jgi:hypothetical protein
VNPGIRKEFAKIRELPQMQGQQNSEINRGIIAKKTGKRSIEEKESTGNRKK